MINLQSAQLYNETDAKKVRDLITNGSNSPKNLLGLCDAIYSQLTDKPYGIMDHRPYNNIPKDFVTHANMHLKGVFSNLLGRDDATLDNITENEVELIAKNTYFDGKNLDFYRDRPDVFGDNYKVIAAVIGMKTSLSISGYENAPVMAMVDREQNPISMDITAFTFPEREPVPPQRPGVFKRILHKMFNAYKDTFTTYYNDLKEYDDKLHAYRQGVECNGNDRLYARYDQNNMESIDTSRALLGIEDEVTNTRERDTSFRNDLNPTMATTRAVEASNQIERTMENN